MLAIDLNNSICEYNNAAAILDGQALSTQIHPADHSSVSTAKHKNVRDPVTAEDFVMEECIGIGSRSVIRVGYFKETNVRYAFKAINLDDSRISVDETHQHFSLLKTLKHENLARFFNYFMLDNEIVLVMALYDAGSIHDIINYKMKVKNCKNGVFDEAIIATILQYVLHAVLYLHNKGIAHRDLKASNILICSDGGVKLSDFFFSLCTNARFSYSSSYWLAPEVLKGCAYTRQSDIWSIGIIAIELTTGHPPYYNLAPYIALKNTIFSNPPNIDTHAETHHQYKKYGKSFRALISLCLDENKASRPKASNLLSHRFFRKAKNKKYLLQSLLAIAPSLQTRAHMISEVKQQRGSVLLLEPSEKHKVIFGVTAEPSASSASRGKEEHQQDKLEQPLQLVRRRSTFIKPARVYEDLIEFEFVLTLRDEERDLNEIRFDYKMESDTAEVLGQELVRYGHIRMTDCEIVVDTMTSLILRLGKENKPKKNISVVFHLDSAGPNEDYDEKRLIGMAKLAVNVDSMIYSCDPTKETIVSKVLCEPY